MNSFSLKLFPVLALASLLPSGAQASQAGQVFRDCKDCPEMVVLPTGTFQMGTPEDEVGREPDEGPMHPVTFAKPLAISRFQVLKGEWFAYLRDTGYTMPDGDERPAGHARPASRTTRAATRASSTPTGTQRCAWTSPRPMPTWPGCQKDRQAIPAGQRIPARVCGSWRQHRAVPFPFDEGKDYSIAQHANTYGAADGYNFTAPAGSFAPNAFGVYDMHGNIYEWTADCYNENYVGARATAAPG